MSLDALLADGGETDETARRTVATHRQTEGNKDQILNDNFSLIVCVFVSVNNVSPFLANPIPIATY